MPVQFPASYGRIWTNYNNFTLLKYFSAHGYKMKSYIFLDLETTGLSVLNDRIVQICLRRYILPGE